MNGPQDFAARLVAWQRVHGRHDLPWQNTRDPYRIWLSEIMLQQTQVATVIPYYARFLARFPDVAALAEAPQDDVLALWAGLGYYSRARNLHRAAQQVLSRHGGAFPDTLAELAQLPGIGRSTAAAVAAFGFGARETILDGNVKRVLARAYGIEGFPGERKTESRLWALAEALLPAPGDPAIGAYTQGLMDLGATVCVRGTPACPRCPFEADCVAHATGRERALPTPRPKKHVPVRQTLMLVLRDGDSVLLEKRPPTGIWGGLWSLPEAPDQTLLAARSRAHGGCCRFERLADFTHAFTHYRLEVAPRLDWRDPAASPAGVAEDRSRWVPLDSLDTLGVPAPVRKLLDGLRGSLL